MAFARNALAATVVVRDSSPDGWQVQHSTCGGPPTGSQMMESGPASPPMGSGSREFRIGPDGDSFETYRQAGYLGTLLDDLTALEYSTYVETGGGQAPYLILNIDHDGDNVLDDQLFFEPVYQTGTYGGDPVPNQGAVTVNTWQTWDALVGGWWALEDLTFGPPLVTIESYVDEHPNARIINTATGQGGIRIATGCGAGAWDNFVGNADAFTIGVNGAETTFDFEPNLPQPANKDACKKGGWATHARANGTPFKNQGDCIQYVNTGK
jgi:hypothetical protein